MGYVDRVAVKVWPDTREFDRDMRRTTARRRKTVIQAVLDAAEARAELKKLENTRTVKDLELRTGKAKAKLAELKREMASDQTKTVEITADIRQARTRIAQLRADMTQVSDKDAKVRVRAEVRDAQDRITRLRADLAQIRNHKMEVQAETTKARKELDRLEKDRKVVVQARVESLNARRELIMLARRRIAEIWVRVNTTAAMANIRKVLAGLSGLNLLQRWSDSLVRMFENLPQTVIKITALASALATLVLPAMSALSALAPIGAAINQIAPALLAAVPLFGAVAGSVTVLAMAFTGLTKTSSVAAKRFKRVLDDVVSRFGKIRTEIQQAFFSSGFTESFDRLSDVLLPRLREGLTEAAREIGRAFGVMSDALGEAASDGRLETFFDNWNGSIRASLPGLEAITHGLANLGTVGSEVLPDMAHWITKIGLRFREWTETANIEHLLRNAARQAGFLWDAMKNLGGVIAGVFRAMDTGKSTGLEGFADTLARIREIVWSPGFQVTMRTIFAGAARGAGILADALGPVGESLRQIAPLLGEILATAGGTAASALIGIMRALAQPAAQEGIRAALKAIATMVESVPWDALGAAVGSLGQTVAKIAPLITVLLDALAPLLPDIIDSISSLIPPLIEIVKALLPALVPLLEALVPLIQALAPVIVALAPVLEALAIMFRDTVIPAINGVTEAMRFLTPLFVTLGQVIATHVAAVTALLRGDWATAWELAKRTVAIAVSGILSMVRGMMPGMVAAVATGVVQVALWFQSIPSRATAALRGAGTVLTSAGRAIIQGFWNGMKDTWSKVASWIVGLAGWIAAHKGPLSYDYALLQPAGTAIMAGFRDAMKAGMRDVEALVSEFAPRVAATVTTDSAQDAPTSRARDNVVLQVTNWYPQAQPTSVTTNEALQTASALGLVGG